MIFAFLSFITSVLTSSTLSHSYVCIYMCLLNLKSVLNGELLKSKDGNWNERRVTEVKGEVRKWDLLKSKELYWIERRFAEMRVTGVKGELLKSQESHCI